VNLFISIFNSNINPKIFFFLGLSISGLSVFSIYLLCVVVFDPMNIFHLVDQGKYVTSDQRIAKSAIVRNDYFDSFVVGSSISNRFDLSYLNVNLDAKFGDVTLGGATSYELLNVTNSLKSNNKYLILELSFNSFMGDKKSTREHDYPGYLWDRNKFNDFFVYFDLIKDHELLGETLNAIKINLLGMPLSEIHPNKAYIDHNGFLQYKDIPFFDKQNWNNNIYKIHEKDNLDNMVLDKNNLPKILDESSNKFENVLVYLPPITAYSLKYHLLTVDSQNINNYLEWMDFVEELINKHENIFIVNYQNINRITVERFNYRDYTHFDDNVAQLIAEDIVSSFQNGTLFHLEFGSYGFNEVVNREDLEKYDEQKIFVHD